MNRSRDIKVGIFVFVGFLLMGLAIFLIGNERRFFESSVPYKTKFSDVQGLKAGAPIRMGGIDIGHVKSVGYGSNPTDTAIYVELNIVRAEAQRIKIDSKVRIVTKGFLGDKMIEITRGEAKESVALGSELAAEEPQDLVTEMATSAKNALSQVDKVSQQLADEQLHKNIRETVSGINTVIRHVSEGDGYPHRFLTDKSEAERISRTLASVDRASSELAGVLAEARTFMGQLNRGNGFAHDLVYGTGPQKQVEEIGIAAREIGESLKQIRESDSLAKGILYGGSDASKITSNMVSMSEDMKTLVAQAKAGKGTLGALLVDPSIYEDMKMLLGNVQRNDVLRALVRYSIKQDEKKPRVEVKP